VWVETKNEKEPGNEANYLEHYKWGLVSRPGRPSLPDLGEPEDKAKLTMECCPPLATQ